MKYYIIVLFSIFILIGTFYSICEIDFRFKEKSNFFRVIVKFEFLVIQLIFILLTLFFLELKGTIKLGTTMENLFIGVVGSFSLVILSSMESKLKCYLRKCYTEIYNNSDKYRNLYFMFFPNKVMPIIFSRIQRYSDEKYKGYLEEIYIKRKEISGNLILLFVIWNFSIILITLYLIIKVNVPEFSLFSLNLEALFLIFPGLIVLFYMFGNVFNLIMSVLNFFKIPDFAQYFLSHIILNCLLYIFLLRN